MVWETVVPILGAGVVRNVAGWLENALEDGKISNYEWGSLATTITRVAVIGTGAFFGFNLTGLEAGAFAVIGDIVVKKLDRIGGGRNGNAESFSA